MGWHVRRPPVIATDYGPGHKHTPACRPTRWGCCWNGVRRPHTPGLRTPACVWCGWVCGQERAS